MALEVDGPRNEESCTDTPKFYQAGINFKESVLGDREPGTGLVFRGTDPSISGSLGFESGYQSDH